jgi:L-asparaginase
MNIHVIHTGGTIESGRGAGGTIDTVDRPPAPFAVPGAEFTHSEPYRILSENLTPAHWGKLIGHIQSITENNNSLNAVFITHGTDTLAYTAAFLALACQNEATPIFLIASDRPMSEPGANGAHNIDAAVSAVCAGTQRGVFVPYQNPGTGEVAMHRGERIMQAGDFSDSFYSMGYNTPAVFTKITVPAVLAVFPKILQIRPYPGIDYSAYDLSCVDAVLHGTYHSGTADADAVIAFAKRAAKLGKDVYLSPVFSEKQYATTKKIIDSGLVTPLYDMTFETAYARLMLMRS